MNSILITGTSRGIGKETAELFLQKGWNVIGLSRTAGKITHPNFTFYQCDFQDEHFIESIPHIKSLDAVCINAGVGYFRFLEQLKTSEIDEMIQTNIRAPFLLTRHILPLLKKSMGNIFFMGSESALQGSKMGSIYCASKAALTTFAEALFAEVRNTGVKVTTLHPGLVDSTWFDNKDFSPQSGEKYSISPSEIAETIWETVQKKSVVTEIKIFPQKNGICKKR